MDTINLCFGQRVDETLGILEPWYVNTCMDRIKQMDLSDKIVFEYGLGASTIWWATKAKKLVGVDHNQDWLEKTDMELCAKGIENKTRLFRINTHEGDTTAARDLYVTLYNAEEKPNIVIVDGVHRYECAEYAVNVLKPEILIVDNHQQDYVFMCPKLDELLKGVRMERFVQADHTDHSGNPWATAIFYLNEKE